MAHRTGADEHVLSRHRSGYERQPTCPSRQRFDAHTASRHPDQQRSRGTAHVVRKAGPESDGTRSHDYGSNERQAVRSNWNGRFPGWRDWAERSDTSWMLGPPSTCGRSTPETRTRLGGLVAGAYEWPVSERFTGAVRLESIFSKSWFDDTDLPPEYRRQATWRLRLGCGTAVPTLGRRPFLTRRHDRLPDRVGIGAEPDRLRRGVIIHVPHRAAATRHGGRLRELHRLRIE